jgi:hypothetical protein
MRTVNVGCCFCFTAASSLLVEDKPSPFIRSCALERRFVQEVLFGFQSALTRMGRLFP